MSKSSIIMYNIFATWCDIMMTLPGMCCIWDMLYDVMTACVKVRWLNLCSIAVSGDFFRKLTYCLQCGWWRTGNGVVSLPLPPPPLSLSLSLSVCHTPISAVVMSGKTVQSPLPLAKLQQDIVTHCVHLPDEQSHHCGSSNYSNPTNRIHAHQELAFTGSQEMACRLKTPYRNH